MRFQQRLSASLASVPKHDNGPGPWRMLVILTALTGLHVGAFVLWQPQRHESSGAVSPSNTSLVFVNVAAPRPARRKLKVPVPVVPPTSIARRGPMPTSPPAPTGAAEYAVPAPPSQVDSVPDVPDLLDRAKASARRLARDMEPATQAAAPLTLEQSLGNAIAAAARPRTTTIEELKTADGRPLSRVSGPAGTYCVAGDGFGPSAGRDPFRDGPRDRVVRCPR
jgi:hypothetical protein